MSVSFAITTATTTNKTKKGYFISYRRFCRSSIWYDLRKKRLAIDNYKCVKCGSGHNLTVHKEYMLHKRPQNFRNYQPDINKELFTLCESCHRELHHKRDISKYSITLKSFLRNK